MKINLKTIGADVEMFLLNEKKNEVISAEKYIKGSKYKPFNFDESNPFWTTSLDNVLAEFTIPPVNAAEDFANSLLKGVNYIKSILPKHIKPIALPAASLDKKWLRTPQALLFGCEPDFNAYSREMNAKPFCEDVNLRSAGGHIHIGYDKIEVPFNGNILDYGEVDDQRSNIVKVLDLFVSVPMVLIEPDNKRKELYGKAGAFRPKEYGLEYRTPSNYYLSSVDLMKNIYNSVIKSIEYLNENGPLSSELSEYVKNTINNNNKLNAKNLIKEFNLM